MAMSDAVRRANRKTSETSASTMKKACDRMGVPMKRLA